MAAPPKWTLLARISWRRTTQKPEEHAQPRDCAYNNQKESQEEDGPRRVNRDSPLWLHYRDKASEAIEPASESVVSILEGE